MARIRYLKPEFFTDEDLAELPYETRIAFEGLWCYADKAGRLEDRPKFLKAMIFPYDNVNMEKQLESLSKNKHNGRPFILRYKSESLKLIQILNWEKHQKPHHTEAASRLPESAMEEKENTPIPPKEKENIEHLMEKGMEKQDDRSTELKNVHLTGNERLKSTEFYNCPFFNEFWECYPKKEGKGKAWEEWKRIRPYPDDKLTNAMKKVLDKLRVTDQWKKDGGQFIPLPATWLHQRRWDDEPMLDTGRLGPNPKSFASERLFLEMMEEMDGKEERLQTIHGGLIEDKSKSSGNETH